MWWRGAMVGILACLCGCGGGGGRGSSSITDPVVQNPTAPDPATLSPLITSREQARQQGKWTIMVYVDADNDLESAGMVNVNQMEKVGSTQDVRIIVQMDRVPGHDVTSGDWADTRRYLITRDADFSNINSVRLDNVDLGELDMASPQTLRDFVTSSISEFPADHYCLVVWDHGSGWQFRVLNAQPDFKYVLSDETNSNGMNVNQVREAIAGTGLDILAFDACLMQQLEVAYEMKDTAHYMVASPAPEPYSGYNYYALLYRVTGATQPVDLCKAIVHSYSQTYPAPSTAITQCAIDLTKMGNVARAAGDYAQMLINQSAYHSGFETARLQALDYVTVGATSIRPSLDLLDYASRCTAIIGSEAQPAYTNLTNALSNAIIVESHSSDMSTAHGLGIYVPASGSYDSKYGKLLFAADTAWDDWLRSSQR